jgi:isoleucyl-tRNA synthetase
VGSSLEAALQISADADQHAALAALGDELRFALIVSQASLVRGEALHVGVSRANGAKCERCWHYSPLVGSIAEHPSLCPRCHGNLFGNSETRQHA